MPFLESISAEKLLPAGYLAMVKAFTEELREIHGEAHVRLVMENLSTGSGKGKKKNLLQEVHAARYLKLPGIEATCAAPGNAEILVLLQDPWAAKVLERDCVSLLNEDPTARGLQRVLASALNNVDDGALNPRVFVWNAVPWYSPFANGKSACKVCEIRHRQMGSELLPLLLQGMKLLKVIVVCGIDAKAVFKGMPKNACTTPAAFVHHPSYYVRGERGKSARKEDMLKLKAIFADLGLGSTKEAKA